MEPNLRPLPHQLSEASYRKYEPLLDQALKNIPNETSFEVPLGMSPYTFVARLRDARVSGIKFRWKTYVDLDKLCDTLNSAEKWVFSLGADDKSVWFKRKERSGRPTELKTAGYVRPEATVVTGSGLGPLVNLRDEEWHALAILVHYGRLCGPFVVKGNPPPQTVLALQDTMNISFVYDDARNETIVT